MKNGKSNSKKEFNPSIGFWPAKSGNGFTVSVNEALIETLKKAQIGSTLYLQEVPEEARADNDRIPAYRVTIFPPRESNDEAGL